jgi:hypothetical protein
MCVTCVIHVDLLEKKVSSIVSIIIMAVSITFTDSLHLYQNGDALAPHPFYIAVSFVGSIPMDLAPPTGLISHQLHSFTAIILKLVSYSL